MLKKVLREAIKRSWEERLINLYGSISDANPKSMLKHAERWLTEHDDSAAFKACPR